MSPTPSPMKMEEIVEDEEVEQEVEYEEEEVRQQEVPQQVEQEVTVPQVVFLLYKDSCHSTFLV